MSGAVSPGRVLVPALALVLAGAATARAHTLAVQCRLDGAEVEVRVGFGRSLASPAADARVRLLDPAGAVVAEGATDAAGVWRAPAPPPGEYRVEATADDHDAAARLTVGPPGAGATTAPGPGRSADRPAWWPAAAVFGLLAAAVAVFASRTRRAAERPPPAPPEAP